MIALHDRERELGAARALLDGLDDGPRGLLVEGDAGIGKTAVWRSAKSYRPERGPAAPWLYAVARNAIVDRQRARTEPPA